MDISIEALGLQMLNVGLAQHDGDWNWQNVSSPFIRIYLVMEGSALLHLPDRTIELRPQRLYVIPANMTHSYECHGKFSHYYLHVQESYKNATDIFDYYDFPFEVEASIMDAHIFATLCSLHPEAALPTSNPEKYDNQHTLADYVQRYNDMEFSEKLRIRGCVLILISRFAKYAVRRKWTCDERLMKALQYIRTHLYENISINDIAAEACVSKQYFISLFTKALGIPPLRYITKKRIERAQLLLATEHGSIQDIAYEMGFNETSYFVRKFREYTGTTPGEYRRNIGLSI